MVRIRIGMVVLQVMLPQQIAEAEEARDAVVAETEAADFYSGDQDHVQATLAKLADLETQLEELEMRWLELEEMTE